MEDLLLFPAALSINGFISSYIGFPNIMPKAYFQRALVFGVNKFRVWAYFWKWDKVFKNRPSKTGGRQPLKAYVLLEADHTQFQFFKGCLPQILLGLFLNTLAQKCLV